MNSDDRLIDIGEIRGIFRLGRTAAYELTHRAEFPDPVALSPRCYWWWASEVMAYTATLRVKPAGRSRRGFQPGTAAIPRRITGTIRAARDTAGRDIAVRHAREAS